MFLDRFPSNKDFETLVVIIKVIYQTIFDPIYPFVGPDIR